MANSQWRMEDIVKNYSLYAISYTLIHGGFPSNDPCRGQ